MGNPGIRKVIRQNDGARHTGLIHDNKLAVGDSAAGPPEPHFETVHLREREPANGKGVRATRFASSTNIVECRPNT
jgi:hypothetical protein